MATKFENMVNGGKIGSNAINVIIRDLTKNETFDAWINADSLSKVDSMLPLGFEMDKISTLQNYFDHNTVNSLEIELDNSQYIYYANFHNELYNGGFYEYCEAMENSDFAITEKLDRKYQK